MALQSECPHTMMCRMSLTTHPSSRPAGSHEKCSSWKNWLWGTRLPAFLMTNMSPTWVSLEEAIWYETIAPVTRFFNQCCVSDDNQLPSNLRKARRNHPRIHTSEEDRLRLRIVSDFLKLPHHIDSRRMPISHDASQYSLHYDLWEFSVKTWQLVRFRPILTEKYLKRRQTLTTAGTRTRGKV